MTALRQEGLFTKYDTALEDFANRVDEYNRSKGFVVVEMEGRECDPDDVCDERHWKIVLEFKSRAYAKDFWTDPEYDRNVVV